jgi:hypothetical protein
MGWTSLFVGSCINIIALMVSPKLVYVPCMEVGRPFTLSRTETWQTEIMRTAAVRFRWLRRRQFEECLFEQQISTAHTPKGGCVRRRRPLLRQHSATFGAGCDTFKSFTKWVEETKNAIRNNRRYRLITFKVHFFKKQEPKNYYDEILLSVKIQTALRSFLYIWLGVPCGS